MIGTTQGEHCHASDVKAHCQFFTPAFARRSVMKSMATAHQQITGSDAYMKENKAIQETLKRGSSKVNS